MDWRMPIWAASLATGVATACGSFPMLAQQQQNVMRACGGNEIARGTVTKIGDGRETGTPPGGIAARNSLSALAEGDDVVLRRAEEAADRYGRIVAYAYIERDGDELFVQGEMVAAGFARVGDGAGRPCAMNLLGREKAARRARLGLWADPYYDVLDAETPADVLAHQGRFVLVEGKVVSARESGATIYVNFGRRWSEDFTVTVLKRNERNFAAAGLDLKGLAGRRVLVRGWIEERGTGSGAGGSPSIEAVHPEQIETADRE
jgi:Staphylococcal nuclease homologue